MHRRGFVIGLTSVAATEACRPKGKQEQDAAGATAPLPSAALGTGTVPKRRLGRTGEQVSMLGLGGSHVGKISDEAESIRLIRSAIDAGVTFIDNCWDYNDGKSEERVGKALRDGYRQRVFLMTKLDGRTKQSAAAQLEQSLKRMEAETIDLVQIHEVIRADDPARCFAPGGAMEAFIEAKRAGKIRFIGFTGHKSPAFHLAMLATAKQHDFSFDTVQLPLNVMDAHYESFERQVLPVLLEQDIGVLGMKSMGSGDILKSDAAKPEECLRYSLSLPTSVVISGMDSMEVLEKNLAVVRNFRPLSDAERRELLARTAKPAGKGEFEPFKTSEKYDGTVHNPHWLEEARL
jgi:predicted aldo/keto reductase-like oxidoreductase